MGKAKEKGTVLIKNVTRFLSVKLTDEELRHSGDELAATVQEINAEADRQKSIKDDLKARLSEMTAKQSKLSNRIVRREEYRDVQVAIELHSSGQVSETRTDTGEVIFLREANEDEMQLPLGKAKEQTESDSPPAEAESGEDSYT